MYKQQEGCRKLSSLRRELLERGEIGTKKLVSMDVVFEIIGYRVPSNQTMDNFNDAIPIFRIFSDKGDSSTGRSLLRLRVMAKEELVQGDRTTVLTTERAVEYCFSHALRFLVALSASSGGICLWRWIESRLLGIEGSHIKNGSKLKIEIVPIQRHFEAVGELHEGHLYGAIQIYGKLHSLGWSDRFYEIYQKGQELLSSPEFPMLNFIEEAYLSFYKCLEYTVMDGILKRRGQLRPRDLADAFKELNIRPTNSRTPANVSAELGRSLIRRRGQYAAHFLVGQGQIALMPNHVYELKSLVDFLLRVITKKLR